MGDDDSPAPIGASLGALMLVAIEELEGGSVTFDREVGRWT